MNADRWDIVYAKGDEGRSWYQEHAATSARLIQTLGSSEDSVVDVGGGASTLVDDLTHAGWTDVTILDVSDVGMAIARERLGNAAGDIAWICADLLSWEPRKIYDIWHDRAVLHFLTTADQQAAYRDALLAATCRGSRVVIGVFGPTGPTQCSGLDVKRFAAGGLGAFLGDQFTVVDEFLEEHTTPTNEVQQFQWIAAVRNL